MESPDIQSSISLLQELIRIPSFSREETETADCLERFMDGQGVSGVVRTQNNIWALNSFFDPTKPTILLNSHHDTVKPNSGYTRDPFAPDIQEGKLFGLGSNDAGGSLVSLLAVFLYFYNHENLRYNLCFAATAEEEVSGANGIACILDKLPPIEFAIVGEPTEMQPAIAEKGLIVLDCISHGKAGHAAREEGINAIYEAIRDIEWFSTFQFPKVSALLGPVKMSVTMIQAGSQHNVVPEACKYVVDVRVTDQYDNKELVELIRKHVRSDVEPRSLRLTSSGISTENPFVQAALRAGKVPFGSPTMSDQALLSMPSLKMGPGHSGRSHMADEFIYIAEIESAIEEYRILLSEILI